MAAFEEVVQGATRAQSVAGQWVQSWLVAPSQEVEFGSGTRCPLPECPSRCVTEGSC